MELYELFGHDIPLMKRHSHYVWICLVCLFDASWKGFFYWLTNLIYLEEPGSSARMKSNKSEIRKRFW